MLYKYSGAAVLSGIQLDSTYEKIQQTVVKPQAPWWLVGPQMATHIVGCGGRVGRVGPRVGRVGRVGPRVLARRWLVVFQ